MGQTCALQHQFKTLEMEGKSTVDVGEQGVRPKREAHEVRGVYGPKQQRELERRQIRYRKCKVARKGISEFYLWEVE